MPISKGENSMASMNQAEADPMLHLEPLPKELEELVAQADVAAVAC
ncbi:hypothetical protein [Variovorax ginsengisoli]|uniref:Uncharacterized protein n=1 Tax=Variovorax ginsengisoli TaxID=363844 RepID=A0ABT8SC42_9BURK|nr:hypothetical protein [Variovorax ginsengisoli]MDN8617140.1 hypothetical protein [Variovorax ginsengisoli]MDO1536310.1 hypothetical protein [Variovorax ginsengisoli]